MESSNANVGQTLLQHYESYLKIHLGCLAQKIHACQRKFHCKIQYSDSGFDNSNTFVYPLNACQQTNTQTLMFHVHFYEFLHLKNIRFSFLFQVWRLRVGQQRHQWYCFIPYFSFDTRRSQLFRCRIVRLQPNRRTIPVSATIALNFAPLKHFNSQSISASKVIRFLLKIILVFLLCEHIYLKIFSVSPAFLYDAEIIPHFL